MTQLDHPEIQPVPGTPLTADERLELERLRREVDSLRTTARPPRRKLRWRSLFSTILIVLGCVLAPVAGLAVWSNNQVSDTDRFVRSISPLIEDPDVQARLTERVTDTIFQYVDVQGIADEGIDALVAQGLPAATGHATGEPHPDPRVGGDGVRPRQGRRTGGEPGVRGRVEPGPHGGPPPDERRPVG